MTDHEQPVEPLNPANSEEQDPRFFFDFLPDNYWLVKAGRANQILKPLLQAILNFQPRTDDEKDPEKILSMTCTHDEVSLVIRQELVPQFDLEELKELGELDICGPFHAVIVMTANPGLESPGILAKVSQLFAEHGLSIFCLSTYNCNYILFPKEQRPQLNKLIVQGQS